MSKSRIAKILQEQKELHHRLIEDPYVSSTLDQVIDLVIECYKTGHKILFCGNGGSAADAQHLAAEFSGRFKLNRKALPALALHSNSSELTAIANDFGYDSVFSRSVEAHGVAGDILFGITTSGKSKNVLTALIKAKEMGLHTVGMCGLNINDISSCTDLILSVPSDQVALCQNWKLDSELDHPYYLWPQISN